MAERRRARRPKTPPAALSFDEQVGAAREAALRLLSVRERSAAELRVRLRQKGFDPEAVTRALDRLRELALQSDDRFAELFASSAVQRGLAGRRIQGELRARGVDPELAAQAATTDPDLERERALALARKRLPAMAGADRTAVYRRVAGMLARRGYDPDTCRWAASQVAGATEEELLDPPESPGLP